MTCSGLFCGVFDKAPEQIKSFLIFLIYFTVRTILFEMGRIQSESALPDDPTFNQIKNNYDKPSFKGICVEFGISSGTDFRFKKGDNHGLRSVFIYVANFGPSSNFKLLSWLLQVQHWGWKAIKGNLIHFTRNYKKSLRGNSTSSWQLD